MALEKSAEELKTLNTMNELVSAGQTRAQNILNEPVGVYGAVVDNNINIYSSSSLDLTATIVLYKK
jgi:hypothetical protein